MIRCLVLLLLAPGVLNAQVLSLPGNAVQTQDNAAPLDSYDLPTGPWDGAEIPVRTIEGLVTRQVYRIDATGLESLQLLRPLRDQLKQAGYTVVFECDTESCGGFDFRFGTDVASPPSMQVDLGDFRFLSASRAADDKQSAVGILVSRTLQAGFVQITRVLPDGATTEADLASTAAPTLRAAVIAPSGDFAQSLDAQGHAVLSGVTFDTGAVKLSDVDMPVLQTLADYMAAKPDLTISIVGHTDSQGGLDGNIAISRRRAAAVIERLVSDYGVPRARLTAAGMGYLSPLASNLDPQGREANRRVEAVVTGPID